MAVQTRKRSSRLAVIDQERAAIEAQKQRKQEIEEAQSREIRQMKREQTRAQREVERERRAQEREEKLRAKEVSILCASAGLFRHWLTSLLSWKLSSRSRLQQTHLKPAAIPMMLSM